MPKTRGQLKRENLLVLDPNDIHWRNLELLTKFMNSSSKIKSQFQTRLLKTQQKKISRTIKHARNMLLLPISGYLKPTDKKSLKTLQEDLEDHVKRKINIETGQIYFNNANKNAKSENPYTTDDVLDFNPEDYNKIKDLEFEFLPLMPNPEEVKILQASKYAQLLKRQELKKQGVNIEKLKTGKKETMGRYYNPSTDEDLQVENSENQQELAQSFKEFQFNTANIPLNRLAEALIAERAADEKYIREINWKISDNGTQNKTRQQLENEIIMLKKELEL